jgi:hypothetical protein
MALHADTRELGLATHCGQQTHSEGSAGARAGIRPEHVTSSSEQATWRRANAATLPITNAELGWDAILKRDTGERREHSVDAQGSTRTTADTLETHGVTLKGQMLGYTSWHTWHKTATCRVLTPINYNILTPPYKP